ncbi:MAG: HAMP domain-containing histidine kinase [Calditrichaeota bacterium]|nr:HAMP domain-containing histidine kinase [Calditrichota bacterium]
MRIKLAPSLSELRKRLKWFLIGILALPVILGLLWLIGYNISILPWITDEVVWTLRSSEVMHNVRLKLTMRDGLFNQFVPHARKLVELEARADSVQLTQRDVNSLLQLSEVNDAFYVDFIKSEGFVSKNSIPVEFLLESLKPKRGEGGIKRTIDSYLILGMVRYLEIEMTNRKYLLMYRHVKPYHPMKAGGVVGVVMDYDRFIRRIPARMDSLARDNWNLRLFAPMPSDTADFEEIEFFSTGNGWQQTLGIMNGNDTLWWYGDRNDVIKQFNFESKSDHCSGFVTELEGLSLKTLVKTTYPRYRNTLASSVRFMKVMMWVLQSGAIIIIIDLVILVFLILKQAKRNQITLAYLAHSIKTPVSRIRLDSDSLLHEMVASPAEEREIISAIGNECGRLELAIQGAALSLERGKHSLNREMCDLQQIVSDTAEAWQANFSQTGIKLINEDEGIPVTGKFDREMTVLLIDNLLDNALRHTELNLGNISEETATVGIRLANVKGKAEIVVDDMGFGIPKSQRKRIFKRFKRTKGDAASGVSGLGLGLALVKEIAEAHRGQVHVTDNDSKGARFVVELPILNR